MRNELMNLTNRELAVIVRDGSPARARKAERVLRARIEAEMAQSRRDVELYLSIRAAGMRARGELS